jgi:hypothetical protein
MTETTEGKPEPGLIAAAAERYFPEGGPEQVQLPLFADLRERLTEFAAARGLDKAEATRMALAAGLAFLADQQTLQAVDDAAGHNAEELERLLARHIAVEADYAVMKHRLWLALQDNQTMSLRDGTLSKSVQGLRALVNKLKRDIATLEAENAGLRAQLAAAPESAPSAPAEPPPDGWLRRVQARVRRRQAGK